MTSARTRHSNYPASFRARVMRSVAVHKEGGATDYAAARRAAREWKVAATTVYNWAHGRYTKASAQDELNRTRVNRRHAAEPAMPGRPQAPPLPPVVWRAPGGASARQAPVKQLSPPLTTDAARTVEGLFSALDAQIVAAESELLRLRATRAEMVDSLRRLLPKEVPPADSASEKT